MPSPVKVLDERGGSAMGWLYMMPEMPHASTDSLAAIELAKEGSGMDEVRLASLWGLVVASAACDEGDIIEVGCGRGGSGLVICKARTHAKIDAEISLVDSFRGLTDTNPAFDKHKNGDMADASPAETWSFIRKHGERAEVICGVYPNSFDQSARYRFAHLDIDTYQSTGVAIDHLIPKMSCGGIIAVDDYGIVTTPGVTKAVNERSGDKRVRWIFPSTNQAVAVVL